MHFDRNVTSLLGRMKACQHAELDIGANLDAAEWREGRRCRAHRWHGGAKLAGNTEAAGQARRRTEAARQSVSTVEREEGEQRHSGAVEAGGRWATEDGGHLGGAGMVEHARRCGDPSDWRVGSVCKQRWKDFSVRKASTVEHTCWAVWISVVAQH